MIRVAVISEDGLNGDAVATVLGKRQDIQVAGTGTTVETGMALSEDVDVLVVSQGLRDEGALRLARHVRCREGGARVLVEGLPPSAGVVLEYLEAGAGGYLIREATTEELVERIRALARGQSILEPEVAGHLVDRLHHLIDRPAGQVGDATRVHRLTRREQEILRLLRQNLTNREIAKHLTISLGTVKNHVHHVLRKLDVRSREDAAFLPLPDADGDGAGREEERSAPVSRDETLASRGGAPVSGDETPAVGNGGRREDHRRPDRHGANTVGPDLWRDHLSDRAR